VRGETELNLLIWNSTVPTSGAANGHQGRPGGSVCLVSFVERWQGGLTGLYQSLWRGLWRLSTLQWVLLNKRLLSSLPTPCLDAKDLHQHLHISTTQYTSLSTTPDPEGLQQKVRVEGLAFLEGQTRICETSWGIRGGICKWASNSKNQAIVLKHRMGVVLRSGYMSTRDGMWCFLGAEAPGRDVPDSVLPGADSCTLPIVYFPFPVVH